MVSIIAIVIFWNCAFIFAVIRKRNDVADITWGLSFVVAVVVAACIHVRMSTLGLRELLIVIFVSAWGLRLSYHIGTRFLAHDQEDIRYLNWRKSWGKTWLWRSYLQIFTLQPLIALVIVSPALWAIDVSPRPIKAVFAVGATLWVVGFLFESISDSQLKAFRKNPSRGSVMDQGLWKWSRHPNYFGEVVQWWGLFLMAADWQSWWLVVSPLTITFFIVKVSGVPMLEELMKNRAGYQSYAARTSLFFPWPPKKGS